MKNFFVGLNFNFLPSFLPSSLKFFINEKKLKEKTRTRQKNKKRKNKEKRTKHV